MNQLDILSAQLGKEKVFQNKNLSPYFTLRTSVTATYYFEPESVSDWQSVVNVTHQNDINLFIMGGGSNYAILSDFIPGLTVRNQYRSISVLDESKSSVDLQVSSGYGISQLVRFTTERGYAGFEYHLGLPGTVGGGVVMNSKWTNPDAYIGDSLLTATVLTPEGEIKTVDREYFQFSYGWSHLQKTKEILLDVVFRLSKENPDTLITRSKEALAYRKETQPHGIPTSGCFFKNITIKEQQRLDIPTRSAGYLIDQAKLKGTSVGGFAVSDKHANFIINTGNGTRKDLKELLNMIKDRVQKKFDVQLKEEVIVIGDETK